MNETRQQSMIEVVEPAGDDPGGAVPVVFDSPHSGRLYPDDFQAAVELDLLRVGEDRFVDDLFADAPSHGATLLTALFARTYVDVNRTAGDIDSTMIGDDWTDELSPGVNTERGVGLIFRLIGDSVPIYKRMLTSEEVRRRLDRCWHAYHDTLQGALDLAHARHGRVWHVNCHSMLPVGNALSPDPGVRRADMVLGDLDGRACAPEFTDFVAATLRGMGYSVAVNEPYKGAYIVERHGRPDEGRHSLQIEINRALYMDLETLERTEGFARLKADMGRLAEAVCEYARAVTGAS